MDKKQTEYKQNKEYEKKPEDGLYGIAPEDSLQSVNFATTENPYLNEHSEAESDNEK
ncbi:hypothetical protein [Alkalihalobacillus sp. AL-G]|uniref:hypothetical protein n=1 Tax=Alkalihalobacillus sp. AL-G TaxID=2926399 RepID=UPI00272B2CD9|nr:hypothetical protein [Alkalihalobacillus sp. AL-G]WLD92613.1 hypothetical protein MOJ78_16580 [Alkalihalobacillus sp. AL-G]